MPRVTPGFITPAEVYEAMAMDHDEEMTSEEATKIEA